MNVWLVLVRPLVAYQKKPSFHRNDCARRNYIGYIVESITSIQYIVRKGVVPTSLSNFEASVGVNTIVSYPLNWYPIECEHPELRSVMDYWASII